MTGRQGLLATLSVARGDAGPPRPCSKVRLLGQDQSVIDLDAEIANRALQLGMTKQELAGAQIAGPLVDQRDLVRRRLWVP